MSIGDKMTGRDAEKLPNFSFRVMSVMLNSYGRLFNVAKLLNDFDIRNGFTVIDYGCGSGNYVKRASELVGEKGKVLAVDIHPLSEKCINKRARKYGLQNVAFVLADRYSCPIEENTADMIYALDMFHMVKDHKAFLTELHRLLKAGGYLIIGDGHQPREAAKSKINSSGLWEIVAESKKYTKCVPK